METRLNFKITLKNDPDMKYMPKDFKYDKKTKTFEIHSVINVYVGITNIGFESIEYPKERVVIYFKDIEKIESILV